jgi:hypothetical protein
LDEHEHNSMSAPSLASEEQAMRRVFTMLGHLHFNSLDQPCNQA